MRIKVLVIAALLVFSQNASSAASDYIAGVKFLSIPVEGRAIPLLVTLWYPSDGGGIAVPVGTSSIFKGAEGRLDAAVLDGAFPTVIVYSGGYRSARNSAAWMNRFLATKGFIVASIAPPFLGYSDAWAAPAEIWKRPQDMSNVLTALMRESVFRNHIDANRVAAVGTLLGGTAALSLVGLRLDASRFGRSCDGQSGNADCVWFAESGIGLRTVDAAKLEGNRRDSRIKAAIAVHPTLTESVDPDSLTALSAPVAAIALGRGNRIAARLGQAMPVAIVIGASAGSSFNECRPKGAEILSDTGGDPMLCLADKSIGRARVHSVVANHIVKVLQAAFDR